MARKTKKKEQELRELFWIKRDLGDIPIKHNALAFFGSCFEQSNYLKNFMRQSENLNIDWKIDDTVNAIF